MRMSSIRVDAVNLEECTYADGVPLDGSHRQRSIPALGGVVHRDAAGAKKAQSSKGGLAALAGAQADAESMTVLKVCVCVSVLRSRCLLCVSVSVSDCRTPD